VLALFTLEPVEENQELHFSYFGSLDDVGPPRVQIIPQGKGLTNACVLQVTRIEVREDVVNGKCYCGAPHCIGTLFPRIIRDDPESGDEGGGEAEVHDQEHNEGDEETGSKGNEMADEA